MPFLEKLTFKQTLREILQIEKIEKKLFLDMALKASLSSSVGLVKNFIILISEKRRLLRISLRHLQCFLHNLGEQKTRLHGLLQVKSEFLAYTRRHPSIHKERDRHICL